MQRRTASPTKRNRPVSRGLDARFPHWLTGASERSALVSFSLNFSSGMGRELVDGFTHRFGENQAAEDEGQPESKRRISPDLGWMFSILFGEAVSHGLCIVDPWSIQDA